jgi:hypothetical protein
MRAVEDVRVRHITYMTRGGQKVAKTLRAGLLGFDAGSGPLRTPTFADLSDAGAAPNER